MLEKITLIPLTPETINSVLFLQEQLHRGVFIKNYMNDLDCLTARVHVH